MLDLPTRQPGDAPQQFFQLRPKAFSNAVPARIGMAKNRELPNEEEVGLRLDEFTALLPKWLIMNGAGEGNRTLVSALGRPHTTIEPHPLIVYGIYIWGRVVASKSVFFASWLGVGGLA
jgi:hypothetical protein